MDPLFEDKTATGTEGAGAGNPTAADASRALDSEDGSTGATEVLTSLGLSGENLSDAEKDRIGKVVQYMNDARSEDSLRMREIEERYNQLESAFEDPRVKAALGAAMQPAAPAVQARAEEDSLITPEELSLISTDPARFLKGLSTKIDSLVTKRVEAFKEAEIEPMKVQNRLQTELTAMDSMFPSWRKDVAAVRDAAKKDPSISTVRAAYERGVLIPNMQTELRRLKAQVTAYQKKTGIEGDSALQASNANGPAQVTQKKVFATDMEAILDAVERTDALRRGGK